MDLAHAKAGALRHRTRDFYDKGMRTPQSASQVRATDWRRPPTDLPLTRIFKGTDSPRYARMVVRERLTLIINAVTAPDCSGRMSVNPPKKSALLEISTRETEEPSCWRFASAWSIGLQRSALGL